MFIDTRSKNSMTDFICSYFSIDEQKLKSFLLSTNCYSVDEKYFDGCKLYDIINDFIIKNYPNREIDELLLFHLGRRLDSAESDVVGKNLFDLLTTENALSKFLFEHEVAFQKTEQHIDLFYKDIRISLENTFETNVPYLRARLGYNKGREDFCFNGFAFRDLLMKNTYTRALFDVPEFIGILATYLNRRDIGEDYNKYSKYYCYTYKVPFEKIMFDENSNLSTNEKRVYLLNQVMQRLYNYANHNFCDMSDNDNSVLRLKDLDNIQANYFVSKEEITYEMIE